MPLPAFTPRSFRGGRSTRWRHLSMLPVGALAVAAVMTLVAAPSLPSGGKLSALEPAPMHFGITASSFHGVNAHDAEVALRLLAQSIGNQQGYAVDTSTRIFEDMRSCETAIKQGGLSLVILDAQDYLAMDIPEMKPAFVHLEQRMVLKEFLLLTRLDGGLDSLPDLRGREILLPSGKTGNGTRIWLEVLLRESGLEPGNSFFQRIQSENNPALTVLPVFFGTKPACIVDRLSFQTMVELNPQVGKQLRPIAVSEPFLESVTCLPVKIETTQQARLDLIRTLTELHRTVAGRQILTLFKVDQLVPYQDQYLDTARKLRTKAVRFGLLPPSPADGASTSLTVFTPVQP